MLDENEVQTFDDARPRLLGLAYRILGSRADAEDAVQDTFLKWLDADRSGIQQPAAWLTTTCTRRCLDLLRAAHRTRVNYVGPWLPEPIQQTYEDHVADNLDLSTSLKTAFLLTLERLTPKERAAYLLYEVFDTPYADIAATLALSESACRKLVSRARSHVGLAGLRHSTPVERQDELLSAFQSAILAGETAALQTLLSEDVQLAADGGGKVAAIGEVVVGRESVISQLLWLREFWSQYDWEVSNINGERGLVLSAADGVQSTVSFAFDETGLLTGIFIMRNPDKLANLNKPAIR